MIDKVVFKDPRQMAHDKVLSSNASYIYFMSSLRGKEFKFHPGVNIIVGENGSGKTSLVRAIRRAWLCENGDTPEFYSHFLFNHLFKLSFERVFDEGTFEFCDVHADYSRPLLNLRKTHEMTNDGVLSSCLNASQFMSSRSMSKGENTHTSLQILISLMIGESGGIVPEDYLDFSSAIEEFRHKHEELKSFSCVDNALDEKIKYVLKYYERNNMVCGDGESPCMTAILDEPDEGMDVYALDELRELINAVREVGRDQFIICLHNVALIKSFMPYEDVNFIEMSKGYLKAISKFGNVTLGKRKMKRTEYKDDEEREDWLKKLHNAKLDAHAGCEDE